MAARGAVDDQEAADAAQRVLAAKTALGEAGPVWWDDGAPDYSGRDPDATPYVVWWRSLPEATKDSAE